MVNINAITEPKIRHEVEEFIRKGILSKDESGSLEFDEDGVEIRIPAIVAANKVDSIVWKASRDLLDEKDDETNQICLSKEYNYPTNKGAYVQIVTFYSDSSNYDDNANAKVMVGIARKVEELGDRIEQDFKLLGKKLRK